MMLTHRACFSVLAVLLAIAGHVNAAPPPTIVVEAVYPGANAQVMADTVAAPIEQQVNGVEKMVHLASRCTNDGTYTLTITFVHGVDLNMAQVLVQNRVSLAEAALPDLVRRSGLTIRKKSPGVLMFINVFSPDDSRDTIYLSNYATIQIKDELLRLPGAGDVALLGQRDYSLRLWLDPHKLAAYNLKAADVVQAIEKQNVQVAADRPPAGKKTAWQFTLKTMGRLREMEQFENIVVRSTPGSTIYLRDVAHVELGARSPESEAILHGKSAVLLGVYPIQSARARDMSAAVHKRLAQLRASFPAGVDLAVAFDFTPNLEAPGRPTTPEYFLLDVALPSSASMQRILKMMERSEAILHKLDGVEDVLALTENPFDGARNRPCILVRLASPDKRKASREQLARVIRARLEEIPAMALRLRDLSGPGRFPRCGYPIDLAVHGLEADQVRELAQKLTARLRRSKKLTDVLLNPESEPQPQLYLDIDRTAAKAMGVSLEDVFQTLEAYLGRLDVNDFDRFGRTWHVHVDGKSASRKGIDDLKQLKVRSAEGQIVPVSKLVTVREVKGASALERLDGQPMVEITANPASEVSLAEVRLLCETLAEQVRKELRLPATYRLAWLAEMPAPK
jgi:multidrug efflux pump subunit AcrB